MTSRVAAVLAVSAAMAGVCAGDDAKAPFEVTVKRTEDCVEAAVEKDKAVFSVHSPRGIGEATIARTQKAWPEVVVLRLHLKGLESFRASNGTVALSGAISTHTGKARIWTADNEAAPLDAKSRYWMDVRAVDAEGKAARSIPLDGGYFELALPKAFFADNPHSIALAWIDFYRN